MTGAESRRPDDDERRFTVVLRAGPPELVLALGGELDHDTAGPLREALANAVAARPERIVVDCAELAFCDSTGLNALLHTRLDAQQVGARLELAALRPPVTRLFEITGADAVFTIYPTLDEALAP